LLLLCLLRALGGIKGDQPINLLSQHITKLGTVAAPYLHDAVHEPVSNDTSGAVKHHRNLNKYLSLLLTRGAFREPCRKLPPNRRFVKLPGQQGIH